MAQETHVKGLAELNKFLQQLPVKLEKNVMRGALRAGMNVIKPAAQANIHSVSHELERGLMISTRIARRDSLLIRTGSVVATLKSRGIHGYIAMWVEFGTKAHFISVQESEKPINMRQTIRQGRIVRASMTTVNRSVLRIGARFVGPTVFHPGSEPRPFMRPALDAKANEAVIATANYTRDRLQSKHGLDTSGVVLEGDE
jgi:HK97 gp10 family phage protein